MAMVDISGALNSISSTASSASDAVSSGVKKMDTAVLSGLGLKSDLYVRGVMIILGLLFIAAGIFSFEKTQAFIVQAGKTAAAAAV